jgi:hypothetical protein
MVRVSGCLLIASLCRILMDIDDENDRQSIFVVLMVPVVDPLAEQLDQTVDN